MLSEQTLLSSFRYAPSFFEDFGFRTKNLIIFSRLHAEDFVCMHACTNLNINHSKWPRDIKLEDSLATLDTLAIHR